MPYRQRGTDPFYIPNREAGWAYRWLGDDPQRLGQHLLGHGDRPGYRIICGKNVKETVKIAEELGFPEEYVDKLKNRIVYGRCILAKIPETERKKREAEMDEEQREKEASLTDQFYDQSERRGVKPFIREKEDMDDRRKFATREDDPVVSFSGIDIPKTDTAPAHGEAGAS